MSGDGAVGAVRISAFVRPSTAVSVTGVDGYPNDYILVIGHESPNINLHADNEQLRRIRDVIDAHLAEAGGAA